MPETPKVLGQSNPDATTLTDLYTVPSRTYAKVSSIVVCNRSASTTFFRVSVAPDGDADSDEHYIYYDVDIVGNDTFDGSIGAMLEPTDVVRCYAGAATLSFNLFGTEVT
jgi:hypothetical protein